MRNSFVRELLIFAKSDPNIFLVTGDLGYGVLDEFQRQIPEQYLNAGIAEQTMLGTAAGLASKGFKVFVYSIANFPTFRALEQIRNDVCYMNNPVTIVSVGAGLSYGNLGYSHHAVEDISIMRALPNIDIYSPCDPSDVGSCLREILKNEKPAYLRLGKGGEPILPALNRENGFPYKVLRSGSDGALLFTGAIGINVLEAADQLEKHDLSVSVIGINSLTDSSLEKLISLTNGLATLTIEEHRLQGGFGSWLLEGYSDKNINSRFARIGLSPGMEGEIGSRDFLLTKNGLTSDAIVKKFLALINQKSL